MWDYFCGYARFFLPINALAGLPKIRGPNADVSVILRKTTRTTGTIYLLVFKHTQLEYVASAIVEESFNSFQEPHTSLAADTCFEISSNMLHQQHICSNFAD